MTNDSNSNQAVAPIDESIVPPAPWERQDGESLRAFSAFTVYRDLPSNMRNLELVSAQLYPQSPWSIDRIRQWSAKYNWVARADAWLSKLDTEKRQIQLEAVKDMATRHRDAGIEMMRRGLDMMRTSHRGDDLSVARQLITEGAKLERMARGLERPTGKDKDDQTEPEHLLSGLSDDELRKLQGVATKAAAGAEPKTSS